MRRPRKIALAAGCCGIALLCGHALAADDDASRAATVRKTEDRLHFQLPQDWPVERRNGMIAPVPVEEYLAMKFGAIEERLQAIEQRLKGFDARLQAVEEQQKTPRQLPQASTP
ncbi:MAG: hypothetical protein HY737_08905 [Candidatus Omnitrophica bacterium]|nr:hypothetical protein [Candidatus Omnitrophota bacterium]